MLSFPKKVISGLKNENVNITIEIWLFELV